MSKNDKKIKKAIKKPVEKTSNIDKLKLDLVNDVVETLKPQLAEHIKTLRSDLQNDFQEAIKKLSIPSPQVAAAVPAVPAVPAAGGGIDLKGIMDKLQNGGDIDINAITSMIGQANTPAAVGANGAPVDMDNLTTGQIAYMKMTQQNGLIAQLLPMIIQKFGGNQGGGALQEIMQRVFYEKIFTGQQMDQMVMQQMAKSMGHALPTSNFMTGFNQAAVAQPVPAASATPGGLIASK